MPFLQVHLEVLLSVCVSALVSRRSCAFFFDSEKRPPGSEELADAAGQIQCCNVAGGFARNENLSPGVVARAFGVWRERLV